jgi:hypothetical protein
MTTKQEVGINELAAAALAVDPVLQTAMRGLILDGINHMRFQMKHGDDAIKTALARALVPYLLKGMQSVDESNANAREREAYEAIRDAVLGKTHEIPPTLIPEVTEDVPA